MEDSVMTDNVLNSLFNFFSKPINLGLLLAIFMTSLILLLGKVFLPEEIIISLSLDSFYNQYLPLVLIVFFGSFFLLVVQVFSMVYKKQKDKKSQKKEIENLNKQHKELFEDPDCQKILLKLYNNKNNPVLLPEHNQKVMLLRQSGMIVRTTNQILGSPEDVINPKFPYVLQTFTEKMIEEKLNK